MEKKNMSKRLTLDSEYVKETKVRCEICGKVFKEITNTHLKTHNVTINEYREQYPDTLMMSEGTRQKK